MGTPLSEIEQIFYKHIKERGDSNVVILITPLEKIETQDDVKGIITP